MGWFIILVIVYRADDINDCNLFNNNTGQRIFFWLFKNVFIINTCQIKTSCYIMFTFSI